VAPVKARMLAASSVADRGRSPAAMRQPVPSAMTGTLSSLRQRLS